nr:nuclear transport factor 2 family protein [uncultured Rhodoferax sp.]
MSRQKAKLHAVMGGTPDDVEAAFYEALQRGDLEKLMACWADEDDIVCIHPGGGRLTGAGAIRANFEVLFAQGGAVHVRPEHIRRVDSLASAVHHVLEKVEILTPEGPRNAHVLATNVYHKTPQGWRLVVHHASPGTPEDADAHLQSAQILH